MRGCLFAVSTWEKEWNKWNHEEHRLLSQRIVSAFGRFLAHLGLIMDHSWKLLARMRSSLLARLQEDNRQVMHYDITTLRVNAIRTTKLKAAAVTVGTNCRLLGLNVEGLNYTRKI